MLLINDWQSDHHSPKKPCAVEHLPLSPHSFFNCFGTYLFGFAGKQLKVVTFMHSVAKVYVAGTREWRIVDPILPDHEPAEPHTLSLDGNVFYLTFNADGLSVLTYLLKSSFLSPLPDSALTIIWFNPFSCLCKVCASYVSQTHLSFWALSRESRPTWTRSFSVPINLPKVYYYQTITSS